MITNCKALCYAQTDNGETNVDQPDLTIIRSMVISGKSRGKLSNILRDYSTNSKIKQQP